VRHTAWATTLWVEDSRVDDLSGFYVEILWDVCDLGPRALKPSRTPDERCVKAPAGRSSVLRRA